MVKMVKSQLVPEHSPRPIPEIMKHNLQDGDGSDPAETKVPRLVGGLRRTSAFSQLIQLTQASPRIANDIQHEFPLGGGLVLIGQIGSEHAH